MTVDWWRVACCSVWFAGPTVLASIVVAVAR